MHNGDEEVAAEPKEALSGRRRSTKGVLHFLVWLAVNGVISAAGVVLMWPLPQTIGSLIESGRAVTSEGAQEWGAVRLYIMLGIGTLITGWIAVSANGRLARRLGMRRRVTRACGTIVSFGIVLLVYFGDW